MEVRGAAEILATLDDSGMLERLPFMPEMAAFCGRRFVVDRRAERLCDTIHYTGGRRLCDTVLLADLRCDGSGHDGCQAECRLFWKEAWVRKVTATSPPAPPSPPSDLETLVERASRHLKYAVEVEGRAQERWRCQATELPKATEHVKLWDPRAYVREYTGGNVTFSRFVRVTVRAVLLEPLRKLGLIPEVHLPGTRDKPLTEAPLHLRPGDLVRVKTKGEIAETLNREGRNRGLWFDREMMPFCGGTYRVRQRISRFIDDRDGRMVELKNDCVTLEGVVCSGELSLRRWFCPRAIFPYWREGWLRRAEAVSTPRRETSAGDTERGR